MLKALLKAASELKAISYEVSMGGSRVTVELEEDITIDVRMHFNTEDLLNGYSPSPSLTIRYNGDRMYYSSSVFSDIEEVKKFFMAKKREVEIDKQSRKEQNFKKFERILNV